MAGWLHGFGGERPLPARPIARVAAAPTPTQTPEAAPARRIKAGHAVETIEVPICGACKSRYVRIYNSTGASSDLVYWECRECGHDWKGPRADHIAAPKGLGKLTKANLEGLNPRA